MHEHEHEHTYTHSHPHEHEHAHGGDIPPAERAKALLGYMIDHNEHHTEELAELVDLLQGDARKRLLSAIGGFEAANVELREVLELLEKGE